MMDFQDRETALKKNRWNFNIFLSCGALCIACWIGSPARMCGQQAPQSGIALRMNGIRIDWPAVIIPVSVTCGTAARTDLIPYNFTVTENGEPVPQFEVFCPDTANACPLRVAFVLNRNFSMEQGSPAPPLAYAKDGLKHFFGGWNSPDDRGMLITFADQVTVEVGLTTDRITLAQEIGGVYATMRTESLLWDAAMQGVTAVAAAGNGGCGAVILVSRDGDNRSAASPDDIIAEAVRRGIRFYPIAFGPNSDSTDLRRIADSTGGTFFAVSDGGDLPAICESIARTMHRSFYNCEIRYTSSCPDGRERIVSVTAGNLFGCGGSDTRARSVTMPLIPSAIDTALLRLGTRYGEPGDTIAIPLYLDNAPAGAFPGIAFRISFDETCLEFLGVSTAGCLLQGIPIDAQAGAGEARISATAGGTIAGPGILLNILFRARNTGSTRTCPLPLAEWDFSNGCLLPRLTDGACGVVVSDVPIFVEQPRSRIVCSGTDVPLSAVVAGGRIGAIRWEFSMDGGLHWSPQPGADRLSWTIPGIEPQWNGSFWRVVVKNPAGDSSVSAPALLLVQAPVAVTLQPRDAAACEEGSALFIAAPNLAGGFLRMWQRSSDNGTTWNPHSGAAGDTLRIQPASPGWNGNLFRVIFTDTCGYADTSSIARLDVFPAPRMLGRPAGDSLCEGSTAIFTVPVSGAIGGMQWQESADGGNNYADITGAAGDTLTLAPAVYGMNGHLFRLKLESPCGAILSDAAQLRVYPATPIISAQPQSRIVCAGDSVSFRAAVLEATGYRWRRNGADIPGATGPEYRLSGAQSSDAGLYTLLCIGACGQIATAPASLDIDTGPRILTQPVSASVNSGDSVRLEVVAAGMGLSYQWMKNGSTIPGATNAGYFIPSVKKSDEGNYSVRISGSCGQPVISSIAQLSVTILSAEGNVPLPGRAKLYPNYPNPFAAATTIQFALPARQNIEISILDMYGRKIETLAAGEYETGRHALSFIAQDYAPGMYMVILRTGNGVLGRMVTVVR